MEDLKIKHLFIVEMKDLECLTFYCRFFRFFLDPSILQFRLPQKTHWVHLPVGISFFVHWKNGTKLVRKLRQSFLYKTQHFYVLSRNLNLRSCWNHNCIAKMSQPAFGMPPYLTWLTKIPKILKIPALCQLLNSCSIG